jgi:anti-sigma factor RsiW
MQPDSITDVLIDRYLRGELPVDEREAFAQRIEQDPALADEVAIRYDIVVGIRAAERDHIRKHLRQVYDKQAGSEQNANGLQSLRIHPRWRLVAAVAGAVAVATAYFVYRMLAS